jgi:phage host-nuclease inhibitor protein Gam
MSASNSTPTVGAMIDKVKELEAYIAAEMAAVTERLAPFQQAVDCLTGAIKQYLLDNGAQNVKSEGGFTAYLSRPLSVKVVDRDAFLSFVVGQNHFEFLDARCLKAPVEELLDANDKRAKDGLPPILPSSIGISAEPQIKCNIRKS